MNLSEMFTDDQMAVLFCLGALTLCGLVAAISYHLGPAGRERRQNRESGVELPVDGLAVTSESQHRRAA